VSRSKPIRWTRQAELDLRSACTFLHERNPEAAQRFGTEIQQAVERIHQYPEIGPVALDLVPRGRYRHVSWKRHRIIYRIEPEVIWILRVWDSRRNPADLIPE
jgi:plasmid stabilization system protein ParE